MKHSSPFFIAYCLLLNCFLLTAQTNFKNAAPDFNITYAYDSTGIGGGISFCDFNNDGLDDLTFATNKGDSLLFYRNNGCGFDKLPALVSNTDQVKQVTWLDVDNDGDKDLFLTTLLKGLKLYENQGQMQLVDITALSGFGTYRMLSHGANWVDFDKDGDLDVYISTWSSMDTISNILYRNNGNKTFSNITKQAGLYDTNSLSYAAAFFDYDKDGWPDLYATTDKVNHPNKLYKNNGNGTFSDVSLTSNTYFFIESMSGTVDDYNNDGWLDFYVTNTYNGNLLLHNNGNGTFTDTANTSGVAMNSWAWGAGFLDGDNDGDLDLYVSSQENGLSFSSSAYYLNTGNGLFTKPFIQNMDSDTARSYGNAIGDFNNDGRPDIAVANRDQAADLWENQTVSGNYLKVALQGSLSNRDGIGSFIYAYAGGKKQMRYTLCGESFLGQFSQYEIFGLATDTLVDSLVVVWPSGLVSKAYDLPVNTPVKIIEGTVSPDRLSLAIIGAIQPCAGEKIILKALNNFSNYSWSTGDTSSFIEVDSSGIYTLTAYNTLGSNSSVASSVVFKQMNPINFGKDTSICQGETLTLLSPAGSTCAIWSDNSNGYNLEVTLPGTYWAEINTNGCISSDTINVGVFQVAQIDLGKDTIICAGDSLMLDAGPQWKSYYWSDNSTGQHLIVSQSGTYSVDATDSNNCMATDDITIYVTICTSVQEFAEDASIRLYPNPARQWLKIECKDEKNRLLRLEIVNSTGSLLLQKELPSNISSTAIDISELPAGCYFIRIESQNASVHKTLTIY